MRAMASAYARYAVSPCEPKDIDEMYTGASCSPVFVRATLSGSPSSGVRKSSRCRSDTGWVRSNSSSLSANAR